MNKNVFAFLLGMLTMMFMFSSCEWMPGNSSGDDYIYYDIKPVRMDVQGVKGFVVAENGSYVSFKINLLNGENNASFSADARKVTSFFRIN